jgi:hypothetical protein
MPAPHGGPSFDQLNAVDIGVEFKIGRAIDLRRNPLHIAHRDGFVGQDDFAHAGTPRDSDLMARRHRDAPGAVLDLPREQLRRHGGLAMRAEQGFGARQEQPHPFLVGRERFFAKDRCRRRQVAAIEVEAEAADIAHAPRLKLRRPRLAGFIDDGIEDPLQCAARCGHRVRCDHARRRALLGFTHVFHRAFHLLRRPVRWKQQGLAIRQRGYRPGSGPGYHKASANGAERLLREARSHVGSCR